MERCRRPRRRTKSVFKDFGRLDKRQPGTPGGLLTSKPTWSSLPVLRYVGFFWAASGQEFKKWTQCH
jgi:hypothetical protein